MEVGGVHYRSLWRGDDGRTVRIIDQTQLPFAFTTRTIEGVEDCAEAMRKLHGPLFLGLLSTYALAIELAEDPTDDGLQRGYDLLIQTRPYLATVRHYLGRVRQAVEALEPAARADATFSLADKLREESMAACQRIGTMGFPALRKLARKKKGAVLNVLTLGAGGWTGAVDFGTALAPVYNAVGEGIPVHVWVCETRPRQQGAFLTAWELRTQKVPHTVIPDSASGYLCQSGQVDAVIVPGDCVSSEGELIAAAGTYQTALAAREARIPFYVAAPLPAIDHDLKCLSDMRFDMRCAEDVAWIRGETSERKIETVRIAPPLSTAAHFGLDITPAKFITGLITEKGVVKASADALEELAPAPIRDAA